MNRGVAIVFLGVLVFSFGGKLTAHEGAGSAMREALETHRWHLPFNEFSAIRFYDATYSLGGFGQGWEEFCFGRYEIDGDRVRIYYPDIISEWNLKYEFYQRIFEWMFPNGGDAVFVFDEDYVDFDVHSRLINGDRILKNYFLRSPAGEEYVLDGVPVIKYDKREDYVVMLANLRMRAGPGVSSPTVDLRVYFSDLNREISGHILHRNSINSFDAVTVHEDVIDGIRAPWYRVNVILDEVYSQAVWVFGGYVERIPPDARWNLPEYYRRYYDTLFDLGVIKR